MAFIIGSGSPRRREILAALFDEVKVLPPEADEAVFPGEKPEDFVLRIVSDKMDSVRELYPSCREEPAVTADTIVTIDGKILGKPGSHAEAEEMLTLLSGREHRVITGLCLDVPGRERAAAIEESLVFFRELGSGEITEYLNTVEYRDKAGSYAIQDHGEMIVDRFEGSLSNIIGFPLRLFFSMISETGLFFDKSC